MGTLQIKRAAKYGLYGIVAFDLDGYQYILNHQFRRDDPRCARTLETIRERKQIDLRYWRKRVSGRW